MQVTRTGSSGGLSPSLSSDLLVPPSTNAAAGLGRAWAGAEMPFLGPFRARTNLSEGFSVGTSAQTSK